MLYREISVTCQRCAGRGNVVHDADGTGDEDKRPTCKDGRREED